jgi:hypothetical protein
MKRTPKFFLLSLFLFCLFVPEKTQAVVYLNRVLNPTPQDPCNYQIIQRTITASETWDANYQNAYGNCVGLPAGPPFILEAAIMVEGTLQVQGGGVLQLDWQLSAQNGGLIVLQGMDVQLNAQLRSVSQSTVQLLGGTLSGNNSIGLITVQSEGSFLTDGTQFTATQGRLINAQNPDSLHFQNCLFSSSGNNLTFTRLIDGFSNPDSAQLVFLNCTFQNTNDRLDYLRFSTGHLRIEGCQFQATNGTGVYVSNMQSIVLENNHFEGMNCNGPAMNPCGLPFYCSHSRIQSIRGNTGLNNETMGMLGSTINRTAGHADWQLNPDFPLLLNSTLEVSYPDSLYLEPGSIVKLFGNQAKILVNGALRADSVVFTSLNDPVGGVTQAGLPAPQPGDWEVFVIDGRNYSRSAAYLFNCQLRYAGASGNRALEREQKAQLTLVGSTIEYNQGAGIRLWISNPPLGQAEAWIHNNLVRYNDIGLLSWDYLPSPGHISGNQFVQNETGVRLQGELSLPFNGNLIAGNRLNGIEFDQTPSLQCFSNVIAANGQHGCATTVIGGFLGDSLRIGNNHLLGNGQHGLLLGNAPTAASPILNNLIAFNMGYGIYEPWRFAENDYRHNAFHQNQGGLFWDDNTAINLSATNQLPGSGGNLSIDPQLIPLASLSVASSLVDLNRFHTTLQFNGSPLPPNGSWVHKLLQVGNGRMYLVLSHTSNQLILADTVSLPVNATVQLYDYLPPQNPLLADAGETPAYLPALDYLQNNRLVGTSVDIGAFESAIVVPPCPSDSILYVNAAATGNRDGSSWADAFTTLYAAGNRADSCPNIREIRVAEGSYFPNDPALLPNQADGTYVRGGLRLIGGFPNTGNPGLADRDWQLHTTVITGDRGIPNDSSDNFEYLLAAGNSQEPTLIDGFILEYAERNIGGGGPLTLFGSQAPVRVRNVWFRHNTGGFGGAVYVRALLDSLTARFENCYFEQNQTTLSGGAVSLNTHFQLQADFYNCFFVKNRAAKGGAVNHYADFGGRVEARYVHCTFADNVATDSAGFVHNQCYDNVATIGLQFQNSILYDAQGTTGGRAFVSGPGTSIEMNHCLVPTQTCAELDYFTGHITCQAMVYQQDPLFSDAAIGIYTLIPGSPALNVGSDSIAPASWLDYRFLWQSPSSGSGC